MVEISAFPANTSVGTTTSIVTCNGTGTGGSLLSSGLVLKEALAESVTGTSASGTNTVLLDIAGVPTLVPVNALPTSGGVALTNGTLTASGTLTFGSGLTLTGSGTAYDLAATSGGGVAITNGTITAAGTMTIGSGLVLAGSGSAFTLASAVSGGGKSTLDPADCSSAITLSGGNLTAATSAGPAMVRSTLGRSAGKLYMEFTTNASGITYLGFTEPNVLVSNVPGNDTLGLSLGCWSGGGFYINNSMFSSGLGSYNSGVLCLAVDFINRNCWFRLNGGNWNNVSGDNPATNTGGLNGSAFRAGNIGFLFKQPLFIGVGVYNGASVAVNFGASAFAQAVPSGFSSWG